MFNHLFIYYYAKNLRMYTPLFVMTFCYYVVLQNNKTNYAYAIKHGKYLHKIPSADMCSSISTYHRAYIAIMEKGIRIVNELHSWGCIYRQISDRIAICRTRLHYIPWITKCHHLHVLDLVKVSAPSCIFIVNDP